jgi:hypothetical protein
MTLDEIDKVTTDKVKNPGRQEWGRKLGKMQKAKKLPEEQVSHKTQYLKWEYLLAAIGITVGLGALYYQKKSYEAQVSIETKPLMVETQSKFSDF